MTKSKLDYTLTVSTLSMSISGVLYYVSSLIVMIIAGFFPSGVWRDSHSPLLYILYLSLHFLMTYGLLSIRRFRSGFPYILGKYTLFFGLIFMGVVLSISALFIMSPNEVTLFVVIAATLLSMAGIFIWIRRGIKAYYLRKMRERAIETLEEELREKNMIIEMISAENTAVSSVNHALSHKLSALELQIGRLARLHAAPDAGAEAAVEYAEILDQLQAIAKECGDELKKNACAQKLPKTKVPSVDAILAYLQKEARTRGIGFTLKITGSIVYMTENVIPPGRLDTLTGDLGKDAVHAVASRGGEYRGILVILGLIGECYEISVLDSGVEFEIETLLALGLRRVTSHSDTGGSGIGYMTVFETMRDFGASLIITEKSPPGPSDYTKAVTVRFDGKKAYRVESYRAEEIRKMNGGKREMIISSPGPVS